MAIEIVKRDTSIFKLLDKEDEKQIVNLEHFAKPSVLVYNVKDHIELSYKGIKHLAILMADKGMPLVFVDSKLEDKGIGIERTWYASVKMVNRKTGQEAEGVSECVFYEPRKKPDDVLQPDSFARTKAHSKAERNAIRKLIPEYLITELIKEAMTKGQVKTIN